VNEFEHEVGIGYLRGMHLNDSKAALGSKKDRHENIGLGHLGLSTFTHVLSDPRTQDIPLVLETPSFDAPGSAATGGMEVWKKEVEVLNRVSMIAKEEQSKGWAEWQDEIRAVVKKASVMRDGKGRKSGKLDDNETNRGCRR